MEKHESGSAELRSKTRTVATRRHEPSSLQVDVKDNEEVLPVEKQEEWTTSKKVVNHKTKQVETRVQRQIVMEDGKVIADSGPQITTRTKEDNKVEESEDTAKKVNGDLNATPGPDFVAIPNSTSVVNEKSETRNITREAKQECLQYHDESLKELSGFEVHKKALIAPNDLISIEENQNGGLPKGKLTHYSRKSNKVTDKDEMKEVSKKHRDGNVTTETSRTHHREELDDDELPEKDVDPRDVLPEASSRTTRKMEFITDYDGDVDPERKLAVEDSIQSHTNRWVQNHFGFDHSIESSKTRAGGNIINIEMTSSRSPVRPQRGEKATDRSSSRQANKSVYYISNGEPREQANSKPQSRITERHQTSEEKSHQQSSSRLRPVPRKNVTVKEDASVQASLSDDSSDESNDEDRRVTDIVYEVRDQNNNTSKPVKTFYFGDDKDTSFHKSHSKRNERSSYHDHRESEMDRWRSTSPINRDEGFISATVQDRSMSSVNNKVVKDISSNRAFQRSYKSPQEREKTKESYDQFLENSRDDFQKFHLSLEDEPQYGSKTYTHPVAVEGPSSFRRDAKHRQRIEDSSSRTPHPPTGRSRSPVPELVKVDEREYRGDRYMSYETTTGNSGTWTKNKSRNAASMYKSRSPNFGDWPEFSPLTSPSELKSISNPFDTPKHLPMKSWNY